MGLQQEIEASAKRLAKAHNGYAFEREAEQFIEILRNAAFMNANTIEYVRLTVQSVAIDSGLSNHDIIWHRLKRLYVVY